MMAGGHITSPQISTPVATEAADPAPVNDTPQHSGSAPGSAAAPRPLAVFAATLRRDLRIELRARDAINAMVFYAVLVIVIFSFAFDPQDVRPLLGGVLWLAFLFSGLVSLDRAFLREIPEGVLAGIRLSPASRAALIAGKCSSSFVFILAIECILLPLFAAFFNVPRTAHWGWISITILLGTWAIAINGGYFSAMSTQTRNRALMLPLLLLPVSLPAILAMVEATQAYISGTAGLGFALKLLFGYDVIFTTLALALADIVLEVE
jgi:heme exporter protein B